MIAKLGTFVEYSLFGKDTTVDWTIISDMKGTVVKISILVMYVADRSFM